jgi:hypothetical protein
VLSGKSLGYRTGAIVIVAKNVPAYILISLLLRFFTVRIIDPDRSLLNIPGWSQISVSFMPGHEPIWP